MDQGLSRLQLGHRSAHYPTGYDTKVHLVVDALQQTLDAHDVMSLVQQNTILEGKYNWPSCKRYVSINHESPRPPKEALQVGTPESVPWPYIKL
ncbi:hypothetical protein NDU88_004700 [Pleurodeles waltl]|uniref:Uncharacterized protein n=1 Tax=Pleurodeles waltl TaxID=8319 RepID=A0AAV7M717_PLEWA|nr:hypothetical protein NDU88_004700 [Pleurodeles waltl]